MEKSKSPAARLRRLAFQLGVLTLPSLLLSALALEVLTRTVLPAAEVPSVVFDEDSRILRFDPAARSQGTYTIGVLGQHRSRWRINNHGWNSVVDYQTERIPGHGRIAIIGDSFVEGLETDVEDNVAQKVRDVLGDTTDVYAFGIAGAPLSQYLHLTRFVAGEYDPDAIVLNVVHNDFTESVRSITSKPAMLQIDFEGARPIEIEPRGYQPNRVRRMVAKSALVRYLWLNVHIQRLRFTGRGDRERFAANVERATAEAGRERATRAVAYIVPQLREACADRTLLVLMTPLRDDVYGTATGDSLLRWMPESLARVCAASGVRFVDMTPECRARFASDGTPFTHSHDAHWNPVGHEIAAQVIARELRGSLAPGDRP